MSKVATTFRKNTSPLEKPDHEPNGEYSELMATNKTKYLTDKIYGPSPPSCVPTRQSSLLFELPGAPKGNSWSRPSIVKVFPPRTTLNSGTGVLHGATNAPNSSLNVGFVLNAL